MISLWLMKVCKIPNLAAVGKPRWNAKHVWCQDMWERKHVKDVEEWEFLGMIFNCDFSFQGEGFSAFIPHLKISEKLNLLFVATENMTRKKTTKATWTEIPFLMRWNGFLGSPPTKFSHQPTPNNQRTNTNQHQLIPTKTEQPTNQHQQTLNNLPPKTNQDQPTNQPTNQPTITNKQNLSTRPNIAPVWLCQLLFLNVGPTFNWWVPAVEKRHVLSRFQRSLSSVKKDFP